MTDPIAMANFVWHAGGSQAETFHRIKTGTRHTVCGRYTGDIIGGQTLKGRLLNRADAPGRECRSCFGHAQTRKPIVGDRRND